MTNGEVIKFLVRSNQPGYNLSKAVEELNELSKNLIQRFNKPGAESPTDLDIVEELGDVEIRVQILKEIFGEEAVNTRIQEKLDRYKKYITDGKYIGRI